MQLQRKKPVSKPFNFDAPFSEEPAPVAADAQSDAKFDDSQRFVDKNSAAKHQASQNTFCNRYSAGERAANGGDGYDVDYAGPGTSERNWDGLMSQVRLLQDPDFMSGEWINSGGHYDRKSGTWVNQSGAVGISIEVLHDVVWARMLELKLSKEVVDAYVLRRGRTFAEEKAFYRLSFEERVNALRRGDVR
jgi:hypothetical protein